MRGEEGVIMIVNTFFLGRDFFGILDIFNKFYSIHHNQSSEIYNPKNNIKKNKMAHASKGIPHKGHIHANLMGIAWILFANLGLWCQYFQSSPIFVQLHTICMVIVIFLTWISGFMAFIEFGFDDFMPIHIALGIAALVIVAMVGVNGVVCKLFKGKPKIKAELVAIIGKIHKFSGWFLLVLAWTQYVLTFHGKKRIAVIILNLISFGGFVLLKYVFKKKAV